MSWDELVVGVDILGGVWVDCGESLVGEIKFLPNLFSQPPGSTHWVLGTWESLAGDIINCVNRQIQKT